MEKHEKVDGDRTLGAMKMYIANRLSDTDYHAFREAIEKHMPKHTPPVTSTIEELKEKIIAICWS
jgi:hypothetical protein